MIVTSGTRYEAYDVPFGRLVSLEAKSGIDWLSGGTTYRAL